ncbi:hypothetical protein MKC54_05275 [[Clostridium] innocuum]|nr:hypothetical protein [[Clostridium] innocuum]MCR0576292.1 hypothetical protein [[Clostridium] innocuum]
MIGLVIDGIKIIRPESYDVAIEDKLTDSSGETEAGTKQYDYVRKNVHKIALSYNVTDTWLQRFSKFRKKDTVLVSFFDELNGEMCTDIVMKLTEFDYSILGMKNRNVWSVSFSLEEI